MSSQKDTKSALIIPSVKSTNKNKQLVAIEGNISSGKSTLCQSLKQKNDEKIKIDVIPECISPRLLSLFYSDMAKYTFALQLDTVSRRIDNIKTHKLLSLLDDDDKTKLTFLDRSVLGDLTFAIMHLLNGNMKLDEFFAYEECFKLRSISGALSELNQILYLHSNPSQCRKNVAKRGEVDQNVETDYLNDIDNLHLYGLWWLIYFQTANLTENKNHPSNSYKIQVLDWRKFGETQMVLDRCIQPHERCGQIKIVSHSDFLSKQSDQKNEKKDEKKQQQVIKLVDLKKDYELVLQDEKIKDVAIYPHLEIEALPQQTFTKLNKKYRFVHSQTFKDFMIVALQYGKTIWWIQPETGNENKSSLFDFFIDLDTITTSESTAFHLWSTLVCAK